MLSGGRDRRRRNRPVSPSSSKNALYGPSGASSATKNLASDLERLLVYRAYSPLGSSQRTTAIPQVQCAKKQDATRLSLIMWREIEATRQLNWGSANVLA